MADPDFRFCDIGSPWSPYLCEACDTWARPLCKPCETALRNYIPILCDTSLEPMLLSSKSAKYREVPPISVNGQKISNNTHMLSKVVESSQALISTSEVLVDTKVLSMVALQDAYNLRDGYLDKENLQKELIQFEQRCHSNWMDMNMFVDEFSMFLRTMRHDTTRLIDQLKLDEQVRIKASERCGTLPGRLVCGMVSLGRWTRRILRLRIPPTFDIDKDELMASHIRDLKLFLSSLTFTASQLVASFKKSQGNLDASLRLIDDAEREMQIQNSEARRIWPLTPSLPKRYVNMRASLSIASAQVKLALDRTDQVKAGLQAIIDMLMGTGKPVSKSAEESRTPVEIMEESLALFVEAATSWANAKTPVQMP